MLKSYEEYMKEILGYSTSQMQDNCCIIDTNNNMTNTYNNEIEEFYPEIYKIIYPMICKACMNINTNVNIEIVNKITEEIYINFESTEISEEMNNVRRYNNQRIKQDYNNQYRNSLLRDLIKILVIRELFSPGKRNINVNNLYY